MQEWQCVYPGCSLYTPDVLVCYNEYVVYASTTTAVVLDILRRHQLSSYTSSSGIAAIACGKTGMLAVSMRSGECALFQLPHIMHPIDTVLLGTKAIDNELASRADNISIYDALAFAGPNDKFIVAVDRKYDILVVFDRTTAKAVRTTLPAYLHTNVIRILELNTSAFESSGQGQSTIESFVMLGGLLSGRLSLLPKNISELYADLASDTFQGLSSDKQRYKFLQLDSATTSQVSVGYNTFELLSESKVTKYNNTMIYLTPLLTQMDTGKSTALSIDMDPFNQHISYQALTVYSCGTILLHDFMANPPRLTGSRKMDGARCACFLQHNPGLIAIGFSSGIVKICNVNVLAKTLGEPDPVELTTAETLKTVTVSCGVSVLILKCVTAHKRMQPADLYTKGSFLSINAFFNELEQNADLQGDNRSNNTTTYLVGCTATGCVIVINCNQYTVYYKTESSHVESILDVCYHDELAQFFISTSADCTAKLWRVDENGAKFEGHFGTIGDYTAAKPGKGAYQNKVNLSLGLKTDGGVADISQFLGPLICVSWDPRPSSCLVLLSSHFGESAIVDIWRGSIYAVLESHAGRVISNAWTNAYGCLCATSSLDGKARVYPFNRSVYLDSPATGFTPLEFVKNYIEFVSGKTPLFGVAFSPHYPILACASGDGKVHLFDMGYLNMSADGIYERSQELGIKIGKTVPVPHLGSFKAHDEGCFKIIFHPLISDVIATSSHDGTIRVFRLSMCAPISVGNVLLDDDGQPVNSDTRRNSAMVRITAISTLKGHTDRVRPLKFHPELSHILFSGSWDTTIRAWNWLAGIELACFNFKADVYGISISPLYPFELVVCSRDVSLRRIHVRGMELGQRAMINATLGALANFFAERKDIAGRKTYSLEDLSDYLVGDSNVDAQSLILTAYNNISRVPPEKHLLYQDFKKPLASLAGSDLCHSLSMLAGQASRNRGALLSKILGKRTESLNDQSPDPEGAEVQALDVPAAAAQLSPCRIFGTILSLFYPADAGIAQLLKLFDYLLFAPENVFDTNVNVTTDMALREFSVTDGLVATGPVLLWMASNMAKLYMKSLSSTKDPVFNVDKDFAKTKYQFYEFTRRQPTLKAEAYRKQFLVAMKLFISLGDIPCMIELLKYLRADDYLAMCIPLLKSPEGEAELAAFLTEPVPTTALQIRMNLRDMITPLMELIMLAQIMHALTGDHKLIQQACYECCVNGETTLAKILAYKIKDRKLSERLRVLVMHHKAMEFLASGRPIKAALELVAENNTKLACRILALTGEAFPAALLTLSDPTQGDFLSIYGTAELIVQSNLGDDILELFLSAARGNQAAARAIDTYGIYLPLWFSFVHANKILRGLQYVKLLFIANNGTQVAGLSSHEQAQIEDVTIAGLHKHASSPQDFFRFGTRILEPEVLSLLIRRAYKAMLQTSSPSIDRAVGTVITALAGEINAFVIKAISSKSWESKANELACLYSLIRGYTPDPSHQIIQLAAMLSYFVGSVAALNSGLFSVAYSLVSLCMKLLEKSHDTEAKTTFLSTVSLETVTEYRTLITFCLTDNEGLCSDPVTLESWQRRRKGFLNHGPHSFEVLLLGKFSNIHGLRCMFTPFTGKGRPLPILTLVPSTDNV